MDLRNKNERQIPNITARDLPFEEQETDPVLPVIPVEIPAEDATELCDLGFTVIPGQPIGEGASAAVFRAHANHRAIRYHPKSDTDIEFWANDSHITDAGKYWLESIADQKPPRTVAIKFVHMRVYPLDRREAELLCELRHRNIVTLYNILRCGLRLYIIMEFCPDGTLSQFLIDCLPPRTHTLTVKRCESFVQQLTAGMLYLHDNNIIHNDVHSRNVMLVGRDNDQTVLKYVDFGLSRLVTDIDTDLRADFDGLSDILNRMADTVDEPGSQQFVTSLTTLAANLRQGVYKSLRNAFEAFPFMKASERVPTRSEEIDSNFEAPTHDSTNPFGDYESTNPFVEYCATNPFLQQRSTNPFEEYVSSNPFVNLESSNPFIQYSATNPFVGQQSSTNPFVEYEATNPFLNLSNPFIQYSSANASMKQRSNNPFIELQSSNPFDSI